MCNLWARLFSVRVMNTLNLSAKSVKLTASLLFLCWLRSLSRGSHLNGIDSESCRRSSAIPFWVLFKCIQWFVDYRGIPVLLSSAVLLMTGRGQRAAAGSSSADELQDYLRLQCSFWGWSIIRQLVWCQHACVLWITESYLPAFVFF